MNSERDSVPLPPEGLKMGTCSHGISYGHASMWLVVQGGGEGGGVGAASSYAASQHYP